MSFFRTKSAQARPNNVRLEVTPLEDRTVPSTLVAEFAGQGVWRKEYHQPWQQLTSANATIVACSSDGNVVAEFKNMGANSGVWRFEDKTGWEHLTTSTNATILDINDYGLVVGEFQGYGVWRFSESRGWQHLTGADASLLGIDRLGSVVGEFVNGVWLYTDVQGSWQHLTPAHASALEIAGNDWVVAEFQGYGVYRWHGFFQPPLTHLDAISVSIDDNGYVAASFQGYGQLDGVWRYILNWERRSYVPASKIFISSASVPGEMVGLFSSGIWEYDPLPMQWNHFTGIPVSMDFA
jgi:hypothetical protein